MNFKSKYSTINIFFFLFSLFVFISTVILVVTTWNEVKRKAILELRYSNEMASKAFASELQQHEILIRLLGEELFHINWLQAPERARPLIEKLLKSDKNLAGFGLARKDGQLMIVSFLSAGTKLPNLAKDKHTKISFEKTLKSNSLTLGRTYYMPQLKKWVIPMRIPIYDNKGSIAFVLTAGIDLEQTKSPWKLDSINSPVDNVFVGNDDYLIYISKATKNNMHQFYDSPVPSSVLKRVKDTSIRLDGTKIVSVKDRDGKRQLTLSSYNNRYGFASAAIIPYSKLYQHTFSQLIYFLLGIFIFYFFTLIFYIIANRRDKQQGSQLQWIANHDILTKLPNRYFLQQKIETWNVKHREYSILFMDLDDFKYINDNYGHPFGDQLLVIIAQRLQKIIKHHEYVIRQGGDEFIILTSKNEQNINHFTEYILREIHESVTINNITLHPKMSIGIAHYPKDASDIDSLLSKADMALYKAKENQLGYFKYSKSLEEISKHRLEIEMELRKGIENKEFYVLLQPQINAQKMCFSGVEALVRWENKSLGFIPPDEFISIAEDVGEIRRIGRFVLQEACLMCLEIYQCTNQTFTLSVNASVEELLSEGYVDEVLEILETINFPKKLLIIEVTESLFIHDVQNAKQVLESLRNEGIKISLDDFGTGYSSLSMLSGLPITEVKIDQSFIRDILIDSQDLDLTKSIIALAKIFNLETVAEGVELQGHVEALQEAGCSTLQGYHFARPLHKNDLIQFISDYTNRSS